MEIDVTLRTAEIGSGVSKSLKLASDNPFIVMPGTVAGEVDVLPAERRHVLEQGGIARRWRVRSCSGHARAITDSMLLLHQPGDFAPIRVKLLREVARSSARAWTVRFDSLE